MITELGNDRVIVYILPAKRGISDKFLKQELIGINRHAKRIPLPHLTFKLEKATNAHIRTQNSIAKLIRQFGLAPRSPKVTPEYDIAFRTEGELWVIEVKSLPIQAEVSQVRIGIGQVLHYKAQLQVNNPKVIVKAILALERKPNFLSLWQSICNECNILLVYGPEFKELEKLLSTILPHNREKVKMVRKIK